MGQPKTVHVAHLRPPTNGVEALRPGRLQPLIDRISKSVLELRCQHEIKVLFHWLQTQIVLLINNCLVASPPGLRTEIQCTVDQSTTIQSKAVSKVVQLKAVQVKSVGRAVQRKGVRKAVKVMAVS